MRPRIPPPLPWLIRLQCIFSVFSAIPACPNSLNCLLGILSSLLTRTRSNSLMLEAVGRGLGSGSFPITSFASSNVTSGSGILTGFPLRDQLLLARFTFSLASVIAVLLCVAWQSWVRPHSCWEVSFLVHRSAVQCSMAIALPGSALDGRILVGAGSR